jgi:hypothetical protein
MGFLHVIANAAKQSSNASAKKILDCFAALAMTEFVLSVGATNVDP